VTKVITSYAAGRDYNFGAFDIADVALGTPVPSSVAMLPTTFTWTRRSGTPTDSYELEIFKPAAQTPYYASGVLGYVSSRNIADMPAGFNLLTDYGWDIAVYSPDGGSGYTNYYIPFRFGKAGIQGRITMKGANAAGVNVELRFHNGVDWSTVVSTTTGSDGIYQFTNAPSLASGQRYYVRYSNTTQDSSRLSGWYTADLTSYLAGQAVNIGNFDIADIPLLAPIGTPLSVPYTFLWLVRPNSPTDHYFIELFDPADHNPDTFLNASGYVASLSLGVLPPGLTFNTTYGWLVGAEAPDGATGFSYYYAEFQFI
jgi:hypothetical protein